jgi:hypothetical protein
MLMIVACVMVCRTVRATYRYVYHESTCANQSHHTRQTVDASHSLPAWPEDNSQSNWFGSWCDEREREKERASDRIETSTTMVMIRWVNASTTTGQEREGSG